MFLLNALVVGQSTLKTRRKQRFPNILQTYICALHRCPICYKKVYPDEWNRINESMHTLPILFNIYKYNEFRLW